MCDDINDLMEKKICHQCIGETYLSNEVRRDGRLGQCSYCDRSAPLYTIETIADRVETAFRHHFRRTPAEPSGYQWAMLADRDSDYEWEPEGEEALWAIANAADTSEEAAGDIQTVLYDRFGDLDAAAIGEETDFGSDVHYIEINPSDEKWREEWDRFESSLMTRSRFFNGAAAEYLRAVFHEIENIATSSGRSLVVEAGPGSSYPVVVRARVFQSDEKLKRALCFPDRELGPPPLKSATAGRMNARGISVFYGSTELDVAIAEVRPPVGSRVATAQFDIVRTLRLLDLTALAEVYEHGSIFDTEYASRLERIAFLRTLCRRIARPVMPSDEDLNYLPTQAIAEFLATEREPGLDGIIYPSIQRPDSGLNIVLFQKAARVEVRMPLEGVEVEAYTGGFGEDGWEEEYWVSEMIPARTSDEDEDDESQDFARMIAGDSEHRGGSLEQRDTALRLDEDSVAVHVASRVQYECESHDVRRHRWEEGADVF